MIRKAFIASIVSALAASPAFAEVEPNVCVARHFSPWDHALGNVQFTCVKKIDGTTQSTIPAMYKAGYRIVSAVQTQPGEMEGTYTTLFLERDTGTGK